MAEFPGSIPSLPTGINNDTPAKDTHPAAHNDVNSEVNAIAATLGVNPQLDDETVVALLERIPRLVHSEIVASNFISNSGGSELKGEVLFDPISFETPGPVSVHVEGVLVKHGSPDVDLYWRLNPLSGDPREYFRDVLLGDWPEQVPYSRSLTINTAPGVHSVDLRALVFAGTDFTMGECRVTVMTAPVGTAFDMSGSLGAPIPAPG